MRIRGISKDRRGKGLSAWRQSSSSTCPDIIAMDASDDAMAFWGVGSFVLLNSRRMEIGDGSVSLRNRKVMSQARIEKVAGIAQGRK
jgi:hypothetical protein